MGFDGLILIISSHGIPDYIVTSDYKLYSRLAIQRTFSFYPILRTIPRFILFDIEEKNIENLNIDIMKSDIDCIEEENIFYGLVDGMVKWQQNEENPDHLIGRVDCTNHGF